MAPIWKLSSHVKAIESTRALVELELNVLGGLDVNIAESIGVDGVMKLFSNFLFTIINAFPFTRKNFRLSLLCFLLQVDSPYPAPQPLNVVVNGPIDASVNAPEKKSTLVIFTIIVVYIQTNCFIFCAN